MSSQVTYGYYRQIHCRTFGVPISPEWERPFTVGDLVKVSGMSLVWWIEAICRQKTPPPLSGEFHPLEVRLREWTGSADVESPKSEPREFPVHPGVELIYHFAY